MLGRASSTPLGGAGANPTFYFGALFAAAAAPN